MALLIGAPAVLTMLAAWCRFLGSIGIGTVSLGQQARTQPWAEGGGLQCERWRSGHRPCPPTTCMRQLRLRGGVLPRRESINMDQPPNRIIKPLTLS